MAKVKKVKTKSYAQEVTMSTKDSLNKHFSTKAYNPRLYSLKEVPVELDGVRKKVFLDRYALKDKEGNLIENSPVEMWHRVAWGIAQVEASSDQKYWTEQYFNLMKDFKFVPGGRILSGAGTGFEVTYFNCFVIPSPQDSRQGILDSLKQLVEIQARAGGVGMNLSSLRPRGARVKKVNGTSSGPVTWAGLFSYATHDVVQQGGSRRGATMLMLHDWHPDIEEFITVKQDLTKINGANLSVCISDGFMQAIKNDSDWNLIYPDLDDPEYDEKWRGEIDDWQGLGKKVKVYKTMKARDLWNLICDAAWRSAEPGLHFLERSNKRSNTWYFEKLTATNPCGEQPLGPWAVCNLGAMNLSSYVKDREYDFESLGKDVKVAMRFLDDVIDGTYYFFPENKQCAFDIRRTGLGIMGLADALIKMKVKYGSDESLPIIRKIFETLRDNAYEASSDMALEKGSFPKYNREKYLQGYHIKNLPQWLQDKIAKQGIRNAVLLTIAPTGTTSTLAGASSGVEPVYEFSYKMRWRDEGNRGWREDLVYHPLFQEWRNDHKDEPIPEYFASANDLTPLEHIKVQAIAQEYIDSSISKTVNAPNAHTVEDVQSLYMAAYDMGLKGITYMRDGSREGVLTKIEEKKEETQEEVTQPKLVAVARPMVLHGRTYEVLTPVGKAFITLNRDVEGRPMELFATVGKGGMHVTADAEAIGRLISIALRVSPDPKATVKKIATQLRGIGGASQIGFGKDRVMSLADAIAKVLAEDIAYAEAENGAKETLPLQLATNGVAKDSEAVQMAMIEDPAKITTTGGDLCPECGNATLVYEEGCKKCHSCSYSAC